MCRLKYHANFDEKSNYILFKKTGNIDYFICFIDDDNDDVIAIYCSFLNNSTFLLNMVTGGIKYCNSNQKILR